MPAQDAVLARVAGGTVFTTVEAQVSQGKGLELGIDIPRKRIRKKWILTGSAWSMRKRKRDGRDTALRWMNNGIKSIAVFSDGCQRTEFTRAASRLHITQPTLSRQLAALEEELGTVLFDRGGRHITLTDEGLFAETSGVGDFGSGR